MAAPGYAPNPNIHEPSADQPAKRRGRIYTRLPRMWIGMALATICLFSQVIDNTGLVVLTSLVGSCYWMFCIHRIHKVLREHTISSYSISPRKAVGLQLIPLFGYIWSFKWTRRIARFVDQESGGSRIMPKVWPGVLLVLASILGVFVELKTVRLFMIFGFGIYLTRMLRVMLPPCRPLRLRRAHQWHLAMSAGVGAAFSFVLFEAFQHFRAEKPAEKIHELAAIFLVSIGVVIFLEPVFERLRIVLGVEEHHHSLQRHRPLMLRIGLVIILAVTSVLHGLLHSEIDWTMHNNPARMFAVLLAAMMVSGGITYFWIAASHQHPPHAARSGLLSGTILSLLVAFGFFYYASVWTSHGSQQTGDLLEKIISSTIPWLPERIANGSSDNSGLLRMALITLPWALFGYVGGRAIDKRWWKGRPWCVPLSIFVAGVVTGGALLGMRQLDKTEMLWHLSVVAGWGLSLIVCSSSQALMPQEEALATDT